MLFDTGFGTKRDPFATLETIGELEQAMSEDRTETDVNKKFETEEEIVQHARHGLRHPPLLHELEIRVLDLATPL